MKGFVEKLPPRYYEMPSRYKDCFYLANASFYDSVNWYLHKAYEVVFPELVDKLMAVSGFEVKRASRTVFNLIEILDPCDTLMDMRLPMKRKDNVFELIRYFKVGHGSYTGFPSSTIGLRMSPDVQRDDLKGLGVLSTHRLAAMDIKSRGMIGAVKIDSEKYNTEELKDIVEQFVFKCLMKGNKEEFVLEPDMNCNGTMVNWINHRKDGQWTDLVASQGAFFALYYFLNNELITSNLQFLKGIAGKTFIIQGIGKMGSNLALYLQAAGAKCVGVKECNSYVYNEGGLDIHEVISYKRTNGTLIGFDLAKPTKDVEIFKKECDMLILAAGQKSILCHFAKSIKARLIVEAAYHPVTPSAYMTLRGHSKIVLPDLLVFGGSAVAAQKEYLEKSTEYRLTKFRSYETLNKNSQVVPQEVLDAIEQSNMERNSTTYTMANVVSNKVKEILNICDQYNLGFDLKTAVFILSIRNLFEGIFSSRRF